MNDRENRRYQMFVRAHGFGTEHARDFAPTSLGTQLFTTLAEIVSTLDTHAGSQVSSRGSAKQGTASREQARQALRDDLEAINRTARAMSDEVTGLNDKFRMPRPGNDPNLLAAARAFLADADAFKGQFIAHELPADFLDDLRDDIAAVEKAISDQSSGMGHSVAAGASIEQSIDDGVALVRKLDSIIKNKYSNNRAVLAEWTSASHTERDPRAKATSKAPASQPDATH